MGCGGVGGASHVASAPGPSPPRPTDEVRNVVAILLLLLHIGRGRTTRSGATRAPEVVRDGLDVLQVVLTQLEGGGGAGGRGRVRELGNEMCGVVILRAWEFKCVGRGVRSGDLARVWVHVQERECA